MNQKNSEKFEILLFTTGALLTALFLYVVKSIWSPLLIGLSILMLLLPYRSRASVKYVLGVLGFIFIVWFVHDTRQLLTPFILSFGLAYLFDPLVQKLERLKIRRWLIVLTIVLLVIAVAVLLLIFLVPQILEEANILINASIDYSQRLAGWVQTDGFALLSRLNIDTGKIQDFALNELPGKIQAFLTSFFKGFINITGAISAALGQALNFVITPFLFFYILKDFSRIKAWLKNLLPPAATLSTHGYFLKIDAVISGFFRGQFIVCTLVGTLTGLGLLLFGINYALIIGIIAGLMNLIPYVGLAITLAISLIIGVFSPSPLITCIKIVAVIESVQIIEGSILSPRIVGNRVGLHPVAVIFSILVFSHFLGFIGLIIAVPAAATLRLFISGALDKYLNNKANEASQGS